MTDMLLRFWGTRGSIPTPGREMEKYGGNTTCLEIRYGETIIVFDAGSGIRGLGQSWLAEFGEAAIDAHVLFTHLHWDHIQGFPFFGPAYFSRNSLAVYGEQRTAGGMKEQLGGQMQGAYFPVPIDAMQSKLRFEVTEPEFDIGPVKVRTFQLPHPGGCLGYRLEVSGGAFVLMTDCELDQVCVNREEIESNFSVRRQFPQDLLDAVSGAHVVVIDCQYTDDQYHRCKGWGHNSLTTVVDFCTQAKPHALALSHHDPQSTDERVTGMVNQAMERLEERGVNNTLIFGAREGLTMKVAVPLKPQQVV
ncbi:MAG: MBL fold metallo-hydrolase [Planctomycetes bacterium]|nr:MBL fold metallo-hydrolase [Planctomycetota bacterium]